MSVEYRGDEIAIVGMSGRFPGAKNVDEFWQNLRDGVESIVKTTPEDLQAAGLDPLLLNEPDFVNVAAALDEADGFDAAFFGYHPKEAEMMDPQHRVLLECAWNALEDAGYDSERHPGLIGVFAGLAQNTYLLNNILPHPHLLKEATGYFTEIGNEKDFPTARISYKLNLTGPSVAVQTACSSSGVAIHLACQSLLNGECDLALAGGCRVLAPTKAGYHYVDGGPLSQDGHIRAFDANAKGMVRGSGVAFIALKRLEAALADGDTIHAIIRGSAINNDGAARVGFTAPSVKGQAAVIAEALAVAGVSAETISYVEAHGTGTNVGDPIEIAGLTKAFRQTTAKKNYCAVGSVKTNVGHLDAGAGVAGVIKTVLALKHRLIPPSLNFENPNPQIDFANTPFYVNARLAEWPAGDTPRRAGVSSFGLGGANAHIVLEEAPPPEPSGAARSAQLVLLSAKTETALEAVTANLAQHLRRHPATNLADAAYTLTVGRRHFQHRRILVCQSVTDTISALEGPDRQRVISQNCGDTQRPVIFMFPGGGAQYPYMAQGLYREEPVFRQAVDECAEILHPLLGLDIRALIYPHSQPASPQLERPLYALPALFTIEYALARLWQGWGVQPTALIGHSMGEYTAACLAGVFSLADGLKLVTERGRLFETLPPGAMLGAPLSEAEARELLNDDLSIAAINKPNACVISGTVAAIEQAQQTLAQRQIESTRIHIAVAAHSQLVEPILAQFARFLESIRFNPPALPYVSNVTGAWITPEQATDPAYWVRHLRQTVRFSDGLQTLLQDSNCIFLETGPGQTLTMFARQHPARSAQMEVVASLRHPQQQTPDVAFLLNSLGRLWLAGAAINWAEYYAGQRRHRIPLPGYPFERKRYWIDPPKETAALAAATHQREGINMDSESNSQPATTLAALPAANGTQAGTGRAGRILVNLRKLMYDLSGIEFTPDDDHKTFLEMGLDSLFLTQVCKRVENEFNVQLKFRQLIREYPTLGSLTQLLDDTLPPQALPAETLPAAAAPQPAALPAPAPQQPAMPVLPPVAAQPGTLEHLVAQQLQLMARQLELLGQGSGSTLPPQPQGTAQPWAGSQTTKPANSANGLDSGDTFLKTAKKTFGAAAKIETGPRDDLTPRQRDFLDDFVRRYSERTQASKAFTQQHRARLADPRAVTGFNPVLKELVYPLIVNRSSGSKLWDVDGNEYVDATCGFGSNLLGHSPAFIVEALNAQLNQGYEIGPTPALAGEVADLMCELTGQERVVFCNTGSEATMGAMRLARTVTGRDKIAMFTNSYHGNYNEVLVRGTKSLKTLPASAGIPRAAVEEILVLEYDSPESLEVLRARANELAAIMVEPVQGHDMNLQPRDFLRQLRQLTEQAGIALIFDEVVTGFRAHLGGAQAYFGVQADIATYGKIIGGGMPMGAIAGRRQFMDALDGGYWQFGDDSMPEVGVTYFAGTFVRHPFALATAKATLEYLKQQGPQLQQTLNQRTADCVAQMRDYAHQAQAPIKISHFSSSFDITFTDDVPYGGLLYPLLRYHGVHIFENRKWFLTTAHSDEDLALVVSAFKQSVAQMQSAEFLPGVPQTDLRPTGPVARSNQPPTPGAKLGRDPKGNPAWYVPDPARPGKYLMVGH